MQQLDQRSVRPLPATLGHVHGRPGRPGASRTSVMASHDTNMTNPDGTPVSSYPPSIPPLALTRTVSHKRTHSDSSSSTRLISPSSPITTMLSREKAHAEFDTPSSYLAQAREVAEGGLWGLLQGAVARREEERRLEEEEAQRRERERSEGEGEGRPSKRRKGIAGTVFSTALDAAIFTGTVGYAAYQLWKGRPLQEHANAAPPPYALTDPQATLPPPQDSVPAPAPPSQRRVTHVHVSRARPLRPRMSHAGRSSRRTRETLAQVDGALADAEDEWRRDGATDRFPSSSFLPSSDVVDASPTLTNDSHRSPDLDAEEGGADEGDDAFDSLQTRIQSLIASGQAALNTPPPAPLPLPRADPLGMTGTPSFAAPSRGFDFSFGSPSPRGIGAVSRHGTPSGIPRPVARRPSGYSASPRRSPLSFGAADSRVTKTSEVRALEAALEDSARGPRRAWWEGA